MLTKVAKVTEWLVLVVGFIFATCIAVTLIRRPETWAEGSKNWEIAQHLFGVFLAVFALPPALVVSLHRLADDISACQKQKELKSFPGNSGVVYPTSHCCFIEPGRSIPSVPQMA